MHPHTQTRTHLRTLTPHALAQLFIEAPLAWGSDLTVTLAATLKLPLLAAPVTLPVTLRALQLSAHVRITARPLLQEWPYAGGPRGPRLCSP